MTPLNEDKPRRRIRELLTAGALERLPGRMPIRALSPAAPTEPCGIRLEAGADVAYFDRGWRAETYVHSSHGLEVPNRDRALAKGERSDAEDDEGHAHAIGKSGPSPPT